MTKIEIARWYIDNFSDPSDLADLYKESLISDGIITRRESNNLTRREIAEHITPEWLSEQLSEQDIEEILIEIEEEDSL